MCENCDDLRSKLEAKVGKLTEGEFKGAKVIATLGAVFNTIVDAIEYHRKEVANGNSPTERLTELLKDLSTAANSNEGKLADPDAVEKLLGRTMTDAESEVGYKMAIHGKSVEDIVEAIRAMSETNETNETAASADEDLPEEIKQLIQLAKDAGAEVRIVEVSNNTSMADAIKQALEEEKGEPTESDEDEDDVEIHAIAMFDEGGKPVSVDMVKYEDFLELESIAVEAIETAEEKAELVKQLQAQLARFKQLRDAVGEFANKTFTAKSGEAVRAGHFLSKEVLHKFPDLYK